MMERYSELRVLRWYDRIQASLQPEGDAPGPIRANLDLTNLCSHACPWCEPLDFRKATIAGNRHTLPKDIAEGVLSDLREMDCRLINFSGGGEPTLHRDFGPLLETAHRHGFRTNVITHGGFIDRWTDYLVDCADHIRVSLDSSCDAEHRQMHGSKSGEFRRVVGNIRSLVKARGDKRSPEIGIAYIVADCNRTYYSILPFLEMAQECGVDFVHFRPVSEQTRQFMHGDWNAASALIAHVAKKFPRLDVRILGKRGNDVFTQREFDKCYAAYTLAVIGANGDVSACCDQRTIVFGSVHEKRFRDIWQSQEHRKKAAAIVPRLCRICLMCDYNRAVRKYVVGNEALPEML
jgi:radical SAM protein with 4Fe4S-binding SPASM domain